MLAGASPIEEVTLKQYSKSLQRVAVLRLLQQLSHVYSVMKIPALADLVPFMSFGEVEQIIVDAVKHDFLQASFQTLLSCAHPDLNNIDKVSACGTPLSRTALSKSMHVARAAAAAAATQLQ